MLKSALLALALLIAAPAAGFAEPPPPPNPYEAGPPDAPGPGSLAGTRWSAQMSWNDNTTGGLFAWVEFRPDGEMDYGYPDGRSFDNGRWRQRGSVITWDTNGMFNSALGFNSGDQISGTMTNVRGQTGRWSFAPEGGGAK
jgi:hypothetical protein